LIIFDLDDTLIDTSGCITPFKLKIACEKLAGRSVSPKELQELTAINRASLRTPDAIMQFGRQIGASKEAVQAALAELTSPLPEGFQVALTPNAKEIIHYYASRCPIALVTGGHPPFQREKLKKAGIEASIFSKIAVPEDSIKKPFYKAFAGELSVDPAHVWVCGDRIPMDLVPARELGFRTIHMRWGRGRQMATEPWIDRSIEDLSELRKIIT
jgi:FMN phosphatase YigB (HAD superfamily)